MKSQNVLNLQAALTGAEMTLTTLAVLCAVERNPGIPNRNVAEVARVSEPTANLSIKALKKEGLVRREEDDNDARIKHVFLTDKGKETLGTLLETIANFHKEEETNGTTEPAAKKKTNNRKKVTQTPENKETVTNPPAE